MPMHEWFDAIGGASRPDKGETKSYRALSGCGWSCGSLVGLLFFVTCRQDIGRSAANLLDGLSFPFTENCKSV
jgi:hypothetical protein